MILELVATATGTAVLVTPAALYAGAKFREHLPIRVPTNKTRIEDAETDLRLHEIARERRQVDYNMDRDQLVATHELGEARRRLEDGERKALEQTEGQGHRMLEVRLLDSARRAFPDQAWGTVNGPDQVLQLIESEADRLRAEHASDHNSRLALADALHRAREAGRLPRYLEDAARHASLL